MLDAFDDRRPSGPARIAVLVSGTGSNLIALADAIDRGEVAAEIAVVVSDVVDAPALARAEARGLPTVTVPFDRTDRSAWEARLTDAVAAHGVELVVLAGFMRILSGAFLGRWPDRVINVHPSLLPAFRGADAVGDALAAGVQVTGVTVHLVDELVDHGPILAQEAVDVLPGDTRDTLLERLHVVEHRLLPRCVDALAGGRVRVHDGHAILTTGSSRPITPTEHAMTTDTVTAVRTALISCFDKTGVPELAAALAARGVRIVSTGSTAATIRDAGVEVLEVADLTGFPECLGGRVKTLHPRVHAGILADRRDADHVAQLAELGIDPIDLVVVNLYPFERTVASGASDADVVEMIDVGGPTMLRAAAKNHGSVGVVVDPADHARIIADLEAHGGLSTTLRRDLAATAFRHTATYDAAIATWFAQRDDADGAADGGVAGSSVPPTFLGLPLERDATLRYGENPHQSAALYRLPGARRGVSGARQLGGKELSFNNLLDTHAAWSLVAEFDEPAVVIIKHTNPSGVALAPTLLEAYRGALAGDPVSAFGGIVALNRPVDGATARAITEIFTEVVVAPGYDAEAREVLAAKANLRVLEHADAARPGPEWQVRSIDGGLLVQTTDAGAEPWHEWRTVSARPLDAGLEADLRLAWLVAKHASSNAIVAARDRSIVGVGAGQMSRVDSVRLAVERAGGRQEGAVAASDAFFPFRDAVDALAAAGIVAIVQPGGSVRDDEVIAAADEHGIAMVLTGRRHFRH